jgi:phage terminase large subunit-like protein
MSLGGYDVYLRKVIEDGKPIFPAAIVLTEKERTDRLRANPQDRAIESIERLKKTNAAKFFGQYLNDPLDEANLEFKRDWIQKFDPTPDLMAKLGQLPVLISVDPAFKLHQYSDDTGIVVSKVDKDNLVYILEAKGIKANPQMLVEEIFRMVENYGNVYKVLLETVTSQIMLMDLLQAEMKRRNKFFVIEEVKPFNNESKPTHIRSLIPHYSNRRIFHAPNLYQLEEQLMAFPKAPHDDIIDALAYQVKYWHATEQTDKILDAPEGSYQWWQKRSGKPMRMGSLFNDFIR